MVSKSSTNPRLRSPKSNKSEAKMDVSFLLQPQFDLWEAVATSLISGRPHSSIHMPFGQNSQKIKFEENWKKSQSEKARKRKGQEKRARKRGTRGRELEHTYSLEPPPPIVEASLCLRSSLTLFQLFVQGRQLVLHLPDFVLREGLLPTNSYEYLVTSVAFQISGDAFKISRKR